MSDPSDFARAIHTPEWWTEDTYLLAAQMEPFQNKPLAEISAADAAQLGALAISELTHLREVVKALALERRPGRSKSNTHEPKPEQPIAVTPLPELNAVELMGRRISIEQARTIYMEFGNLLLNATDAAEGMG